MTFPLAEVLAASAPIVTKVARGSSLAALLEGDSPGADLPARAALRDITYGTLRRYGRVQRIVELLSHRPKPPDPDIQGLLWCALYAFDSARYADYTVVDQALRACEALGHSRAKPFVNALLRNFLRGRAALEARLLEEPVSQHWHPDWWIKRLRDAYPCTSDSVLAAGNMQPPMALRVNARKVRVETYLERLRAATIEASQAGPHAILLQKPVPVALLPGFAEGEVSVQDLGAQQAAPLLDAQPGMRVLDACAAPGGKSSHLLELADIRLTALEVDPARVRDLRRTLGRLQLAEAVEVHEVDCADTGRWWDGRPFDRILADVPCSASGIVRRHPDIKWLRRSTDPAAFSVRQSAILNALWRVLGPGGKLLYVTCSVFPEENGAVVEAFLARTPQASRLPLPGGMPDQWLPGPRHDGFYFALLEKPR